MKAKNKNCTVQKLKITATISSWDDDDETDNDYGDFEEEWLPQDAW